MHLKSNFPKMLSFSKYLLLLTFMVIHFQAPAQRQEEILEYHSEIEIQSDGALFVKEKIKVRSTGDAIKRGIIRSFPVIYKDKLNNRVKMVFEVNGVTKDGKPEPFEVVRQGDYEVIRIGDEKVFLSPGTYDYVIQYTTENQIGFFEEYDELYWNAIGGEWSFKINKATARITLPPGGEIIQHAAYAGPVGSESCPCEVKKESDQVLFVEVSQHLNPGEPLTVAVAWQKGIVPEPDFSQKARGFFRSNAGIFILLIGLLLIMGYYFYAWRKVGKDPYRGGVYPKFEAPDGLDAPASRYLNKMGFDATVFVAGMVQLATKNAVKITEAKKGKFIIEKLSDPETGLSPAEQKMISALFPPGNETVELTQKEHKKIRGAMSALKKDLSNQYSKSHFRLNHAWLLPGIIISLLFLIIGIKKAAEQLYEEEQGLLFLGLVFVFFSVIFLKKVIITFLEYLDHGFVKTSTLIGEVLVALFLIGIPSVVILHFDVEFEYGLLILVFLIGLTNALFFYLMKAPTAIGRKTMDEIEGFRMYLNIAEKPVLEHLNPPGITPEIFEKYLPYALALGVGEAWGKAFENKLQILDGQQKSGYHPSWYTGRAFQAGSLAVFSKSLNQSFGSALNNSASPPGSSSGSGGGGSSGGGGGGGGGGGW